MAKSKKPKHQFCVWRDGRPRFVPGPRERDLGLAGRDLKHADGVWFTYPEMCDFAAATLADIKRRRVSPRAIAAPLAEDAPTIEALLRDFLASRQVREKIAAVTRRAYHHMADTVIYEPQPVKGMRRDERPKIKTAFAKLHVAKLTVGRFNDFVEAQIEARGLWQARKIRAVLSNALNWGAKVAKWESKIPKLDWDKLRIERVKINVKVYDKEQIEAILKAADVLGRPSVADAFYLGFWTGQRQTDRLAFVDGGVDPKTGWLKFRQSKTGAIVEMPPSASLRRRLDQAAIRKAELKLAHGLKQLPDEIVINERTGLAYSPERNEYEFSKVFGEVRNLAIRGSAAAGLAPCPSLAGMKERHLRATCVTMLFKAGANLAMISQITGHSIQFVGTIIQHYCARDPELAGMGIVKLELLVAERGIAI